VSVQVVSHPLASSMLADLRDRNTPPPLFRLLAKRLALVLCLKRPKACSRRRSRWKRPWPGRQERDWRNLWSPSRYWRAGLGMLDAVTELFPEVTVGYVGLERDTQPSNRSLTTPSSPAEGRAVLLLDPMLATGASAAAACGELEKAGAAQITLLSVVSAPEGIARLKGSIPKSVSSRPQSMTASTNTPTSSQASATRRPLVRDCLADSAEPRRQGAYGEAG